MSGTLWLGAGLCGFGFVSAIIVIGLDKHGTKQLGTDGDIKTASKLVKPKDILNFNVSFWLLALTIMFFYNGNIPWSIFNRVKGCAKLSGLGSNFS